MTTSKPIAVRLPIVLEKRLKAMSEKSGRPMSFYIRKMIDVAIDELEDELWAQEAVEEWIRTGKESVPLSELRSKLEK